MRPRFNIVQALTLLSADALLLQHQRPTAGSDTVNMKREEGPLNLLLDCILFKRMAPRSSFKGGIPDIDHLYRTSCTIKQSYNFTKRQKKQKTPTTQPNNKQCEAPLKTPHEVKIQLFFLKKNHCSYQFVKSLAYSTHGSKLINDII